MSSAKDKGKDKTQIHPLEETRACLTSFTSLLFWAGRVGTSRDFFTSSAKSAKISKCLCLMKRLSESKFINPKERTTSSKKVLLLLIIITRAATTT